MISTERPPLTGARRSPSALGDSDTWAASVLDWLEDFLRALPVPPSHRALLRRHLDVGRTQAIEQPKLPSVQLPLTVHAAITGLAEPAFPLAAACTLIYLGADLLDNVADEELPPDWASVGPGTATLAATTLLGPLTVLVLERLAVSVAVRWQIAQELAATLLAMGVGQATDIAPGTLGQVTPAQCRAIAEAKSGAQLAGYARAAALLAGAHREGVDRYAEIGMCLGTAGQLASDLGEALAIPSHDLRRGTLTLPIVLAHRRLDPAGRTQLERLLDGARSNEDMHAQVQELLVAARVHAHVALTVELYRRRGLTALEAAEPLPAATAELADLLADVSLLPGARRGIGESP
jgi:geranylgeranyl diphosphate synthase, type I